MAALKSQVQTSSTSVQDLTLALNKVKEKNTRFTEENTNLQESLSSCGERIEELQGNVEALTKAASSFDVDKKNMLTAIDKQASQIADLKATNEELSATLASLPPPADPNIESDLRSQIASLEETIAVASETLSDERENFAHEISALKQQLVQPADPPAPPPCDSPPLEELKVEVSTLKKTLAATKRNMENTTVMVARANNEAKQAKDKVEKLTIQLDESAASLEYAMENEATLQTQVEELQAQLDQADEGLPDSSPQDDDNNNADMIAEMQQLKDQLNDKMIENDGLRGYLLSRVDDALSTER
ncbi:hypothetical protein TrRE_jg3273 [Triparma retinervis]|uniref:Uncharacterized protein n=1 Tax=Triparma retinervis TaxID=2557542 RepID=A0A9W6ZRH2_9STRA|nr:hypothetical protein TrRE_jg3273 [Triparma retinervis]